MFRVLQIIYTHSHVRDASVRQSKVSILILEFLYKFVFYAKKNVCFVDDGRLDFIIEFYVLFITCDWFKNVICHK